MINFCSVFLPQCIINLGIFRTKEKRQWLLRSKSKKQTASEDTASLSSRASLGARLEKRWSAVSQAASFKRNRKRTACSTSTLTNQKQDQSVEDLTSDQNPTPNHHTPNNNQKKTSSNEKTTSNNMPTNRQGTSRIQNGTANNQNVKTSSRNTTPKNRNATNKVTTPNDKSFTNKENTPNNITPNKRSGKKKGNFSGGTPNERKMNRDHSTEVSKGNAAVNSNTANLRKGSLIMNKPNLTKQDRIENPGDSEMESSDLWDGKDDYVRISKMEYEEIKSRVSEIERCISMELESFPADPVEKVQSAYEKTLVEAEPLSPTTDHLVRRFSRELKIRRGVIRSPSARKIGSLRRRSRELERQSSKLKRTQSWHVVQPVLIPRVPAKRSPQISSKHTVQISSEKSPKVSLKRSPRISLSNQFERTNQMSSPFNGVDVMEKMRGRRSLNVMDSTRVSGNGVQWTSAEGFFTKSSIKSSSGTSDNCRASIARLRSQNAGMVLAKAKLFDELIDTDLGAVSTQTKPQTSNKIGAIRNLENYKIGRCNELEQEMKKKDFEKAFGNLEITSSASMESTSSEMNSIESTSRSLEIGSPKNIRCRLRTLRAEATTNGKKCSSPKRRTINSPSNRQRRLQLIKAATVESTTPLKKENFGVTDSPVAGTPKQRTPQIKKTLMIKSPKRLMRTPGRENGRQTPLKAMPTPKRNIY